MIKMQNQNSQSMQKQSLLSAKTKFAQCKKIAAGHVQRGRIDGHVSCLCVQFHIKFLAISLLFIHK